MSHVMTYVAYVSRPHLFEQNRRRKREEGRRQRERERKRKREREREKKRKRERDYLALTRWLETREIMSSCT